MPSTRCAKKTAVAALAVAAVFMGGASSAAETLNEITKDVRFDPLGITVSGVSSGAYMAVQFQVAHSSMVKGVGVIAGGPYLCARHTNPRLPSKPPLEGMNGPSAGFICTQAWVVPWYAEQHYRTGATTGIVGSPDINRIVLETTRLYRSHKIDNPTNLRTARVWLFTGGQEVTQPHDIAVPPYVVESAAQFYRQLGSKDVTLESHPANHSMVIDNDAAQCPDPTNPAPAPYTCVNACGVSGGAYINNCNYDAAGELLKRLYKSLPAGKGTANAANLHTFEQKELSGVGLEAGLSPIGHVYVPTKCSSKEDTCKLHIALHGCLQSYDNDPAPEVVTFYRTGGYNEWAEANNIVILYPQIAQATLSKDSPNPTGCWDWWGYQNDKNYPTRDGRQIKALKAMVDQVLHRG